MAERLYYDVTINLESVQDGDRTVERSIAQHLGIRDDLEERFPTFCNELGIEFEQVDGYCLLIRDENLPVRWIETLCKFLFPWLGRSHPISFIDSLAKLLFRKS